MLLRTLRETRGVTQKAWADLFGYSVATIRRWETGAAVPTGEAEEQLVAHCEIRGLFRVYDSGPLRGTALSADVLRSVLAEARLEQGGSGQMPESASQRIEASPGLPYVAAREPKLPSPMTTLIDRERELTRIRDMLRTARLLTLTGPGGAGKTRIALEIGRRAPTDLGLGVTWVDLAPLQDASLVLSSISQALGVRESPVRNRLESVQDALQDAPRLLILDNFEHLPNAAPDIAQLLRACSELQVLVTSRSPLHIYGEQGFEVPPLPVPAEDREAPVDALASNPAVTLFVERGRASRADFELTNANASSVAAICRQLDGLPLALELAAVRLRVFSPEAMLARVDQALDLLTTTTRDLPERQRGLRAAINWSHDLLSEPERATFRRVAVFAGGWTLDAAREVCATSVRGAARVLESLDALVDKSLVRVEFQRDGEPRFTMLETIREFAAERLMAAGEVAATHAAHATWYARLAEALEPALAGSGQLDGLEQMDREIDNFRAALGRSFSGGDPLVGTRIAAALAKFWEFHGHLQEGGEWLNKALSVRTELSPGARARLCRAAGHIEFLRGDASTANALLTESLTFSKEAGDSAGVAESLINLAWVAMTTGNDAHAEDLLKECLPVASELADTRSQASTLHLLGLINYYRHRRLGDARELVEESLSLRRSHGDRWGEAQSLCDLGLILHAQGDASSGLAEHVQAMNIWLQLADLWGLAYALEGLAILFGTKRAERAVELIGTATAARERVGIRPLPGRRAQLQTVLRACAEILNEEAYAAAWALGQIADAQSTSEKLFEELST